jgi:hypothetical protein
VLEDAGLLLGEDDDLPGPFGEALKHAVLSYLSGNYGGGVTRSFPLDRHIRRSPERWRRTPTAGTTLPTHLGVNFAFMKP